MICVYMFVCNHICVCVFTCIFVYACACICMSLYMCSGVQTERHAMVYAVFSISIKVFGLIYYGAAVATKNLIYPTAVWLLF